jgi:hypothetical protein
MREIILKRTGNIYDTHKSVAVVALVFDFGLLTIQTPVYYGYG